ncbi:hypothetical protein [Novosphingobium sp. ST904]|uniref:hypothetical protein n=1 Tax=Novosphingobium sp. ST904 TaxID=1684385 RepID=UPI0012E24258|nr:hypothetical protein [Novosphingobium sp. ST904]
MTIAVGRRSRRDILIGAHAVCRNRLHDQNLGHVVLIEDTGVEIRTAGQRYVKIVVNGRSCDREVRARAVIDNGSILIATEVVETDKIVWIWEGIHAGRCCAQKVREGRGGLER